MTCATSLQLRPKCERSQIALRIMQHPNTSQISCCVASLEVYVWPRISCKLASLVYDFEVLRTGETSYCNVYIQLSLV